MQTPRHIVDLIFVLTLALVSLLLPARGEMCSAVTRATPCDDLIALRDKTFAAFEEECRMQTSRKIKSCAFVTEPSTPYSFKFILGPLCPPFRLDFTVKTMYDAIIGLAEETTEESIFAQIGIGNHGNQKSTIGSCYRDGCPVHIAVHEESGLVSSEESRPFWVEYNKGNVSVGKGGQEEAFVAWDAGAYHGRVPTQVHIGISTWEKAHGDWVFYKYCY